MKRRCLFWVEGRGQCTKNCDSDPQCLDHNTGYGSEWSYCRAPGCSTWLEGPSALNRCPAHAVEGLPVGELYFGGSHAGAEAAIEAIDDLGWGLQLMLKEKGVQDHWKALLFYCDTEEEARKVVAARLRELADHIEADKWPQVFGVSKGLCRDGIFPLADFIEEFRVALSYPWGG